MTVYKTTQQHYGDWTLFRDRKGSESRKVVRSAGIDTETRRYVIDLEMITGEAVKTGSKAVWGVYLYTLTKTGWEHPLEYGDSLSLLEAYATFKRLRDDLEGIATLEWAYGAHLATKIDFSVVYCPYTGHDTKLCKCQDCRDARWFAKVKAYLHE